MKHTKPTNSHILEEDDEDSDEEDEPTLKKQFVAFVTYKTENGSGTHISLTQSDFWMKHAGIIKRKMLTTTDTGVCYFKFKKHKLTFNEYLEFLQVLADYKKIKLEEIVEKLINCGPPPQEGNLNIPQKTQ